MLTGLFAGLGRLFGNSARGRRVGGGSQGFLRWCDFCVGFLPQPVTPEKPDAGNEQAREKKIEQRRAQPVHGQESCFSLRGQVYAVFTPPGQGVKQMETGIKANTSILMKVRFRRAAAFHGLFELLTNNYTHRQPGNAT